MLNSKLVTESFRSLESWQAGGEYLDFGPDSSRIFIREFGNSEASCSSTLLLLHGFPESSFSFHLVLGGLMEIFDRIILFDMLGYGFSDKPLNGYSYSLLEQADSAFAVWKHFGVRGGHVLAHDMGDSVATELLARSEEGSVPSWFSEGFNSFTFTNGSIVMELAELRITQKILLSSYGRLMRNVTTYGLFKHQVKSAHGNEKLPALEIKCLWLANTFSDGHKKAFLTIKYLNDRKKYEKSRWLPAVASTNIPIHICWGADDAVARVEMAFYLKENICPRAKLTIMEGLGHFCQLGSPEKWVGYITDFYNKPL